MSKAPKGWVVRDSKSGRYFNGTDWGEEKQAHRFPSAIAGLQTVSKMFKVGGGSSVAATGGPYDGTVSVVLQSDIPPDNVTDPELRDSEDK